MRDRAFARSTGLLVALLLGGPALPPGAGILPAVPIPVLAAQEQEELRAAARGLAGAWADGSDEGVSGRFVGGQVRLRLEANVVATLPKRQATAVLRDYLRGYEPGEAEVVRAALVDGSADRGFAELRWTARRAGTSQRLERTLFFGFRHEGGRWALDEVRVMP